MFNMVADIWVKSVYIAFNILNFSFFFYSIFPADLEVTLS